MKIATLVHNPPFQGGIVQYCVMLNNEIYGKVEEKIIGYKHLYPSLIYKGVLPKVNKSGINFKQKPDNFVKWHSFASWVKAYKKLSEGDIIHLHWVSPQMAPLYLAILMMNRMFARKPVLLTCHNIEPHEHSKVERKLIKACFSMADDFVVHAAQNKTRLVNEYGIKPEHVHVIHHGPFDFFKRWKKESKDALRKKFGISKEAPVLLFFGYIREYKGLRYLIDAMPAIVKENPDAMLMVAGELWQKWKPFRKKIEKSGIQKNVKLFSYFIPDDEVYAFFDAADICVLPYYNSEQTISGPLLVSLAFGKPTIVGNVGGVGEMIDNNENGILIEGGKPALIAEKVNMLIKDRKLREKLSRNALKTSEKYSWEEVGKEYIEVYKQILRRCRNYHSVSPFKNSGRPKK